MMEDLDTIKNIFKKKRHPLISWDFILSVLLMQVGPTWSSKSRSSDYVTLSVANNGLREIRLSYQGVRLLETSLVYETPLYGGMSLMGVSDGRILVESARLHGLLKDCANKTSKDDLRSFRKDFFGYSRVIFVVAEADMMAVYKGEKSVSEVSGFQAKNSAPYKTYNVYKNPPNMSRDSNKTHHSSRQKMRKVTANQTGKSGADSRYSVINGTHPSEAGIMRVKLYNSFTLYTTIKANKENKTGFYSLFEQYLNISKEVEKCREYYKYAMEKLTLPYSLVNEREQNKKVMEDELEKSIKDKKIRLENEKSTDIRKEFRTKRETARHTTDSQDTQMSKQNAWKQHQHYRPHIRPKHTTFINPHHNNRNRFRQRKKLQDKMQMSQPSDHASLQTEGVQNSAFQNLMVGSQVRASDVSPQTIQNSIGAILGTNNDREDKHNRDRNPLARHKRDEESSSYFIMTGTKWCGAGNISDNYDDLGVHEDVDKCCRWHDHCPKTISSLGIKFGMRNYWVHTISHCQCDFLFRHCLGRLTSPVAEMVGYLYFNILGPVCFQLRKTKTCVKTEWLVGCKEYALIKTAVSKSQRRFKERSHRRHEIRQKLYKGDIDGARWLMKAMGWLESGKKLRKRQNRGKENTTDAAALSKTLLWEIDERKMSEIGRALEIIQNTTDTNNRSKEVDLLFEKIHLLFEIDSKNSPDGKGLAERVTQSHYVSTSTISPDHRKSTTAASWWWSHYVATNTISPDHRENTTAAPWWWSHYVSTSTVSPDHRESTTAASWWWSHYVSTSTMSPDHRENTTAAPWWWSYFV